MRFILGLIVGLALGASIAMAISRGNNEPAV